MKLLATLLLTVSSVSTFAKDMDVKTSIESSKQFKAIVKEYKKLGGGVTCFDYQVVSSTDLKASLPGFTMVVQAVVANCSLDLNDGLDDIQSRLLSFVTITTDHSNKTSSWKTESTKLVEYLPQPD